MLFQLCVSIKAHTKYVLIPTFELILTTLIRNLWRMLIPISTLIIMSLRLWRAVLITILSVITTHLDTYLLNLSHSLITISVVIRHIQAFFMGFLMVIIHIQIKLLLLKLSSQIKRLKRSEVSVQVMLCAMVAREAFQYLSRST